MKKIYLISAVISLGYNPGLMACNPEDLSSSLSSVANMARSAAPVIGAAAQTIESSANEVRTATRFIDEISCGLVPTSQIASAAHMVQRTAQIVRNVSLVVNSVAVPSEESNVSTMKSDSFPVISDDPARITHYRLALKGDDTTLPFPFATNALSQEDTHAWTIGTRSLIKIPTHHLKGQVKSVRIKGTHGLVIDGCEQVLRVSVNGQHQDEIRYNESSQNKHIEILLPRSLGNEAEIVFETPNACLPNNGDLRKLAISMNLIDITFYKPRRPLIVFLHGLGGSALQMKDTIAPLISFDGSNENDFLCPDAAQHGTGPGAWFTVDLSLVTSPEVINDLSALESQHAGIVDFAHRLFKESTTLFGGDLLTAIQPSHPLFNEGTTKGYLPPLLLIAAKHMEKLMARNHSKLDEFINLILKERDLTEDDLVLCGHSAGAITALYSAFKRPNPCRAVIAVNGFCPPIAEAKAVPKNIIMIGGKADSIIPFWLQDVSFANIKNTIAPHAKSFFVDTEGHDGFSTGTQQAKVIKAHLQAHYY